MDEEKELPLFSSLSFRRLREEIIRCGCCCCCSDRRVGIDAGGGGGGGEKGRTMKGKKASPSLLSCEAFVEQGQDTGHVEVYVFKIELVATIFLHF